MHLRNWEIDTAFLVYSAAGAATIFLIAHLIIKIQSNFLKGLIIFAALALGIVLGKIIQSLFLMHKKLRPTFYDNTDNPINSEIFKKIKNSMYRTSSNDICKDKIWRLLSNLVSNKINEIKNLQTIDEFNTLKGNNSGLTTEDLNETKFWTIAYTPQGSVLFKHQYLKHYILYEQGRLSLKDDKEIYSYYDEEKKIVYNSYKHEGKWYERNEGIRILEFKNTLQKCEEKQYSIKSIKNNRNPELIYKNKFSRSLVLEVINELSPIALN